MFPANDILKSSILDYKVIPISDDIKNAFQKNGEKKLFISLFAEQTKEISDFLEKVFGAVNLDLENDAYLAFLPPGGKYWFTPTIRKANSRFAFFFGIQPREACFNLSATLYQPVCLEGITYVFADEVTKIIADRQLKLQLWKALQTIFPTDTK